MFPYIPIGSFQLPMYGVMLAVGFLFALRVLVWRGSRLGLDSETVTNFALCCLIGGLIGARIFHIAFNPGYYAENPECIVFSRTGLSFQGGVIGGALAGWFFAHKKSLPKWTTADAAAPAIAVGQAFGRIGCFLNGCCWGKPTSLPWGITFRQALPEVSRHPTQLYSTSFNLLLVLYLIRFCPRRFPGEVMLRYVLGYGTFRFFVEFLRDDPFRGGSLVSLSAPQIVSLVAIAAAATVYVFQLRRLSKDQLTQ